MDCLFSTSVPTFGQPCVGPNPDTWATLTAAEPGLSDLASTLAAPVDSADYGRTLVAIEDQVNWFVTIGTLNETQADEAYRQLRKQVEVAI